VDIIELREAFKSASGFSHWDNARVDKQINSGIKFLDSITFTPVKDLRFFATLEAGSGMVIFPMNCRAVKDVWIMDTESRERVGIAYNLNEIRSESLETGRARVYKPISVEVYGKNLSEMEVYGNFADITFTTGTCRGMAFFPKADKEYKVEINGKFDSIPLSDSNKENWWGVNYPEVVVQAAIYTSDVNFRNSSGGMEIFENIKLITTQINNDAVEDEEGNGSSVMEG